MHPGFRVSLSGPQSQNPQNRPAIPAVLSFRIEQIYPKSERLFVQVISATFLMEVLPKRFNRYGLSLHPEKTKVIPFRKPFSTEKGKGPGTFDFLGFTCKYSACF